MGKLKINDVWDSEAAEYKAIEKSCLMKQLGAEEGLKLYEQINSEDVELPEDYDQIDFDAIDAADSDEVEIDENYVLEEW